MDVLDELERRLAEAIEADRAASSRPRRRHRLLRPLPLATVGALTTLAVVGIVVLTLAAGGGDGGRRPRPASSPVLLERAAEAAEHAAPPPVLRDGELWYVRGEGVDQWTGRKPMAGDGNAFEGFGLLRRYAVEQWSGLGKEGRIRRLTVAVAPRFARDRAAWNATPPAQRRLPPDRDVLYTDVQGLPLPMGLFPPRELRDLPTEPAALLDAIEAAVQRRAPEAVDGSDALATASFEAIRELLLLPVQPAQRAALLRAWALLPGTRVARIDVDARGRRGVVLVYTPRTHPRKPRVLVVGDRDGRLLAERGPRNSPETTYVVQGVAANALALPRGAAPPKARLPRTERELTPPHQ